jgi:hypothetical protein
VLTRLARFLAAYDSVDLLATVGALQLLPENADRTIRLEAFAHAAASVRPRQGRPKIDRKQLAKICHTAPLGEGDIASAEDPLNNPFTEAFGFVGGSYTVFPGIADETSYVLRHLAKAIFLRAPLAESAFARRAQDLVLAMLVLSHALAERTGLTRNIAPGSSPERAVFIPREERLKRLKSAVTWSRAELNGLLASYNISINVLDPLIAQAGDRTYADYVVGEGPLLGRPIVEVNKRFIVALPGRLLAAARHALINLAITSGARETLAETYHTAVLGNVRESLRYLAQHMLPGLPLEPLQQPGMSELLLTCDTDMLVYVLLITDTWLDYDLHNSHSDWPFEYFPDLLRQRLAEVEQAVFEVQPPNAFAKLVLVQNGGRFYHFGLQLPADRDQTILMIMTAADLETIALLEGGDPLALWKYGRAAQQARSHGQIFATSELDEFDLYRSHQYSYYTSDDTNPNLLSIMPGGAGELRLEVLGQRDWHSVPSYRSGYMTEVTTLYGTADAPIYIERHHLSNPGSPRRATVLVEGAPLLLWIVGPHYEDATQHALHSHYAQFAETIGYWLWQCTPSLEPSLAVLAADHSILQIILDLPPDPSWEELLDESGVIPTIDEAVQVVSHRPSGILYVTFRPLINALLRSADNAGERAFLHVLLRGMRLLLPDHVQSLLSDDVIARVIDNHAPLGIKKKLLILDSRFARDIDDRGLPADRLVHHADQAEVLDAIGNYLRKIDRLTQGPIPDLERTNVLRQVVGFLYNELKTIAASLSSDGLLEWLIAHHEATVQATAFRRLTMPTQLACFGSTPEAIKRLMKVIPRQTTTAIASRFVIEYIAARPPQGQQPISLRVYDRLLALAAEIVNRGFESDLIHHQLADLKLSALGSGRLGIDRDAYEQAWKAFQPIFATGEVSRATGAFSRYWPNAVEAGEQPQFVIRLDAAAQEEFGYSLTDILRVLEEAMDLADDDRMDGAVALLSLDEMTLTLAQRLEWTDAKVRQIIELLALGPRDDFLRPSAPHRGEDVYPWRFNRALSYLRRPFVLRERNGVIEVLWGKRHTYTAWGNLINLCLDGRLRANSSAMRQLMGELHHQRGEEFNDTVADILTQQLQLEVRRRVKKVGHLRGPHGPPGDIDVLAFNPQQRRLYVIECKDLAVARTPHELANEVANLFQGQQGKKAIVELHQRRVDWVRTHFTDVLAWLGYETAEGWVVVPLIIVDQELMGAYLQASPIPIVSLAELKSEDSKDILDELPA